MRKVTLFLLAVGLLLPAPIASAASAKVGGACSKAGSTATASGKKLVCVKTGKKLLWKLATPVSIIPTTPTIEIRSAVSAKSGFGCDLENQESFSSEGPLRCVKKLWTVVAEEDDSIATRAYRSVLKRYNENPDKALSLQFTIQPESPEYLKVVKVGMLVGAKLWNVPTQRDEPYPVLIGTSGTWLRATSESMKLYSPESSWTNIARQRQCSYAEFKLANPDQQPWYLYCFGGEQSSSLGFLQVGAHEYTHLAQYAFLNSFSKPDNRDMTPWFQEGFASYIGTITGFASSQINSLRNMSVQELRTVTTPLADYDETFPPQWGDVYPMGTFAAEALTALFGVEVMEKVCKERAVGTTFPSAMAKVTGKKPKEWTPIFQGYIDSIKADKPWSLDELKRRAA